jgi:hypothetical protein
MQNGIAFFLILALAANELIKCGRSRKSTAVAPSPERFRTGRMFAISAAAAAVLMIATSGQQLISTSYMYRAERAATIDELRQGYENAVLFYPDNAAAYFSYGMQTAAAGEPGLGAFYLQNAIGRGLGTTVTYSLMAMLLEDAGDRAGAESAMAEAVVIYPRSVFARVRYSVLLEASGKTDDARRQMGMAIALNEKAAIGWLSLIRDGSTASEFRARTEQDITTPAELRPQTAVLYFTDEFRRTKIAWNSRNDARRQLR